MDTPEKDIGWFVSNRMEELVAAASANIPEDYTSAPLLRPVERSEQEAETRFTYAPPKGSQTARYIVIRAIAKELARAINRWCPPSRERELALTALDQVVMWANAAIARRE